MIRPEVVRRRLDKLDEYIGILRKSREYSLEEFTAEPEHYGSAERFLQLAIEATIDIGAHLVAELDIGSIDAYKDIPQLFSQAGHISPRLEERWIRMIGLRNILVHEYSVIEHRTVYRVLQDDLGDLESLKKSFVKFL